MTQREIINRGIEQKIHVEKWRARISKDSAQLLVRFPKELVETLGMKKGMLAEFELDLTQKTKRQLIVRIVDEKLK